MTEIQNRRTPTETAPRGSVEAWLDGALDLFLEGGVGAVKIVPLAERLKLARTSFYWFFEDREALLSALAERWRGHNTPGLIARAEAYADSLNEAILNLFDAFFDDAIFDSRLEFAIRAWSIENEALAREVRRHDERRVAAVTRAFLSHGAEPLAADVRARALYLTQIGYITSRPTDTIEARLKRIPDYVAVFSGSTPEPQEFARFAARVRAGARNRGRS